MGTAPLFPLMLKMALPGVAAQLVNLLYNIVDRIYIGHIAEVGTEALAGVGVCSTLIILISAFSQFIGGGGAPLASIALGKGDRTRAEKILNGGFTFLMIFSIILILIFGLTMKPFLFLIGASDATYPYASVYFSVYLVGTPAVMVTLGLNSFINAQGRAMTAMLSVILGAAINIVLDPVLIFAFNMGVAGAAWATVISQYLSAFWILHFLLSEKATLRLRIGRLTDGSIPMRPDLSVMKSVFSLGLSPFIMTSTESLVGFALNGSLAAYGDIYVSALAVMQSAMQFVSVPMQGFSQGCVPVLSYNYGHGDMKRVTRSFHILLAVQFIFGFLLILLMILFPAFTAGIFTQDQQLIDTVRDVMPVFLFGMLIFGLQRACQNTFVALGQAKISIFIALLRKVILLIPLVYILQHFIGLMGVFAAEAAADGSAAICCTVIFAVFFRKILKRSKTEEVSAL